ETTTDADGRYGFTELTPGTYSVRFVLSTLPNGFTLTTQDVGGDALDSDADPTTGESAPTTLDAGEDDPTLDAGIVPPDFDLEAVKDIAATEVRARVAVWDVAAINRGPDTAIGPITIIDRIPANQTFVEVRNTTGSCSVAGQVVTCVFDTDLAAGERVTGQVVTSVAPGADSIDNSIQVTSPFSDGELAVFSNTDEAVSPFGGELPRTGGSGAGSFVGWAFAFLLAGAVALLVTRRQRNRWSDPVAT
ncbi:MAG: SdrD B-like domain-containing protein, partial [Actinomycetota bacterium]